MPCEPIHGEVYAYISYADRIQSPQGPGCSSVAAAEAKQKMDPGAWACGARYQWLSHALQNEHIPFSRDAEAGNRI
jgi:hypothetical protein